MKGEDLIKEFKSWFGLGRNSILAFLGDRLCDKVLVDASKLKTLIEKFPTRDFAYRMAKVYKVEERLPHKLQAWITGFLCSKRDKWFEELKELIEG